jgi:hypothetical protein
MQIRIARDSRFAVDDCGATNRFYNAGSKANFKAVLTIADNGE